MLSTRYCPYFSVRLAHQYFSNGLAKDIEIQVSHQTATFLGGLDWINRRCDGGMDVYVNADSLAEPACVADAPSHLQLLCYCRDPAFFQYTEQDTRQTAWFTIAGTTTKSATTSHTSVMPKWLDHPALLALSQPNQQPLLTPHLVTPSLIAVIELPTPAPADIPVTYECQFAARAGLWKYYLCRPTYTGCYRIEDRDGQIAFTCQGTEKLSDQITAMTFVSDQPLLIGERQQHHFDLFNEKKVLARNLALATPIHYAQSATAQSVFEIYL